MGHYTGYALHLKLKVDIPERLVTFFDKAFNRREEVSAADLIDLGGKSLALVNEYAEEDPITDFFSGWLTMSGYFDMWRWSVFAKIPAETHYALEVRCSRKFLDEEKIVTFLQYLLPVLIVKDGEVLARSIYEDSRTEEAFWYNQQTGVIVREDGYCYDDEYEYPHPRQHDLDMSEEEIVEEVNRIKSCVALGKDSGEFIPPMNIEALRKLSLDDDVIDSEVLDGFPILK